MADVTKAVEVAEAVAAPAVGAIATGQLDTKKVLIVTGVTLGVAGLGVVGYMAVKKRKAKKECDPDGVQTENCDPDGLQEEPKKRLKK